ncbi:AAA domain-containing protein [Metabacillus herbersteinensis]|uniref:AAA domain-containing protein n=1 Tax=Metabacillus herbersteinensis TaxID=283816 RepID=A0ABV6GIZ2_9BACI
MIAIRKKIARVHEKIRQKEIEFVKEAQIIGTTLAKAASDPTIYEKDYDIVIVDEASMAYVPQAGFAASLGKHVIISGDFKQLPPIASARHPLVNHWLKEDIFHRANVVDSLQVGKLHPQLFLLKEQRRMHPDISAFTNRVIYKSLVGDHKSVITNRNDIVAKAPFPNRASIMIDTSFTGQHAINERTSNSRLNLFNLMLSFQLLHESYLAGARSIGYVSPYRAQANLMETLLNDLYKQEHSTADIISATVHRFQGSERDVMIFDTVDSYPQERAGMLLTGKESERLINVAITRTKGKFIQVSDTSFIGRHVYPSKTLRQLVEHQKRSNQNVQMKEVGSWIKNQHSKVQWMHARKLERVFNDIQASKRSIIISLPEQTTLSENWSDQLTKRNKKVKLTMISSEKIEGVDSQEWLYSSIPFPFVIIDKRYLWLGLPIEGAKCVQPPYLAIRLDSVAFTEQFLSQLPIK